MAEALLPKTEVKKLASVEIGIKNSPKMRRKAKIGVEFLGLGSIKLARYHENSYPGLIK